MSREPRLPASLPARFFGGLLGIWKSITFRYKQFFCFFLAMFICQSFCWILILSNGTNNRHVYDTVLSRYDYHLSLEGLTDEESKWVRQAILQANTEEIVYQCKTEELNDSYTVYVKIGEGGLPTRETRRLYDAFVSEVLPSSGIPMPEEIYSIEVAWELKPSPLYTCYDDYIRGNNLLSILIAVPLAVVSALLLMFLYNIRLKDQKFMFGIYMAFGADFKKLFVTAAKELLLLSAVSLVPSFLFSFGVIALIYLPRGIQPVFPVWQVLLFLLFNFAIVFLSVYLPTKRLSHQPPLSLISAQDNSDSVTSPRRSFRLFGKTFPRDYELFGILRFRTYYIRLVLTATLFAACFLCGICLTGMYEDSSTEAVEEYVISLPDVINAEEALDDCGDIAAILNEIEGVSHVCWSESISASALRAFMLMQKENGRRAAEYTVAASSVVNTEENTKAKYEQYVDSGYATATNYFSYTLYDEQMIDYLCNTYTVDGDPYAILNGTAQIIISESLFNRELFDFEPGDTVLLCECVSGQLPDDQFYADERIVLTEQLKICGIRFRPYTVCAVVRDMPSSNRFTVGVNASDYEMLTDQDAMPETLSVYLEHGLSFSEVDRIDGEVRSAMDLYIDAGYALDKTENYLSAKLTEEKFSGVRTVIWSCLIFALSPLIWFFSQVLFYRKREKEFWILRAFGAFGTDIRGIHIWGGLVIAVVAVVAFLIEGFLCSYLLYAFCNYILAAVGILSGARYTFSISAVALILALVATAVFAFLSAYVPYLLYRKREDKAEKISDANDGNDTENTAKRTEDMV